MADTETKTFKITTSPGVMRRLERFLALLHWNSRHGHSGTFAMPLDGDGADKVTVDPVLQNGAEVDLIGNVGASVEVAYDHGYGVIFEKHRETVYQTAQTWSLFRDGEPTQTSPRKHPLWTDS